uniref:Uncharacterized protein n=1 Tax=Anguilla anguilla TaxID=7936 RepID=A0A0E9Q0E1_ANGAN
MSSLCVNIGGVVRCPVETVDVYW